MRPLVNQFSLYLVASQTKKYLNNKEINPFWIHNKNGSNPAPIPGIMNCTVFLRVGFYCCWLVQKGAESLAGIDQLIKYYPVFILFILTTFAGTVYRITGLCRWHSEMDSFGMLRRY